MSNDVKKKEKKKNVHNLVSSKFLQIVWYSLFTPPPPLWRFTNQQNVRLVWVNCDAPCILLIYVFCDQFVCVTNERMSKNKHSNVRRELLAVARSKRRANFSVTWKKKKSRRRDAASLFRLSCCRKELRSRIVYFEAQNKTKKKKKKKGWRKGKVFK